MVVFSYVVDIEIASKVINTAFHYRIQVIVLNDQSIT